MKRKYIIAIIMYILFSKTVFANNTQFIDIENHWAKEIIIKAVQNDVINGYGDNTFRPDNSVTIAEFLKMIINIKNYKIERVGNNVWPSFYIETAKKNNLITNEYSDYNTLLTRYDAVKIISNIIDLNNINKSNIQFKDLKREYKTDVLKLVKLNIVNGYNDKTFRGENTITRAEAVTILSRMIDIQNKNSIYKTYSPKNRVDLSNYKTSDNNMDPNYEIKNNNILIFDNGRYSNSHGYKLNDEIINVSKVLQEICALIRDNTYTEVVYSPSEYTINQLRISHGENKKEIENGGADFIFTFYENTLYKLRESSGKNEFNDDCYLKIELIKMWRDYSDYLNKIYIDEYKKEVLLKILEIEFGYQQAENILEYMIEKNINFVSNVGRDKEYTEVKQYGKYIVCFYQKEYEHPIFYISKL